MSNEVLNDSFFANKEIPMCEKLGLVALILGGTYEENALSQDGKDQSFFSMVFVRGGRNSSVGFTYGHPETLSPIACKSLLNNLNVGNVMNIDKMFDGSMSDEEIINKLNELYRTNPDIDKSKFGEKYQNLTEPKIKKYFEKLKVYDSVIANNPQLVTKLLETCKTSANLIPSAQNDDKKKQLM